MKTRRICFLNPVPLGCASHEIHIHSNHLEMTDEAKITCLDCGVCFPEIELVYNRMLVALCPKCLLDNLVPHKPEEDS